MDCSTELLHRLPCPTRALQDERTDLDVNAITVQTWAAASDDPRIASPREQIETPSHGLRVLKQSYLLRFKTIAFTSDRNRTFLTQNGSVGGRPREKKVGVRWKEQSYAHADRAH
jgi:hypothetical protein